MEFTEDEVNRLVAEEDQRYAQEIADALPDWVDKDPEWRTTLHLLTAKGLRGYRLWQYIDFDDSRFDAGRASRRASAYATCQDAR